MFGAIFTGVKAVVTVVKVTTPIVVNVANAITAASFLTQAGKQLTNTAPVKKVTNGVVKFGKTVNEVAEVKVAKMRAARAAKATKVA